MNPDAHRQADAAWTRRKLSEDDVAELAITNLSRRFPSGGGLNSVSLAIDRGEFFVLLGPSGCGKSTLLRLIAGLDQPDEGAILLGEEGAARDGASARGMVAMVFQNYALYPHMTAFENIAFPLKLMGRGRQEIALRVAECARMAGLAIDLGRRPAKLSGGERQRVALARALVREPRLILMDEPLSNLDARLRLSLRVELKEFQRRTGRTFVYVTHDQVEALTLADRMAVMREGRIEQVGTPAAVYARPINEFVASFVGAPPMNLIRASVAPDRTHLVAGDVPVMAVPPAAAGSAVTLGIRPEDLSADPGEGGVEIGVTVERTEFEGARFRVLALIGDSTITVELASAKQPGERCCLYAPVSRLHFFDTASGRRLN